ncbi:rhodanese-like domain-containing protein [Haloarcula salinisoli]|uniref:Rhodanese-like domain-containing protein n=1 Tax=Haloarcula salinisoli TaxID=2487746 RepID=A0A8J8CDA7_9EURY|nr:rhodanese-like domain-containing protein [Halomicroarcula salinisoli]MBX0287162.1 rhodanese-like domain-containing protein [Halomicroarcula salinisoli]MBX0304465.1 rhodanese-like domain-containing protein [Halomicroarcula salinisoli]
MDGEIGNEEMRELLDADGTEIIDIRSPAAFRRGHIPGSENVPLPSLVDSVEQFDDAERVVTVCPKGKSSVQAARLIASYEGFDGRVESFEPGLTGWDGGFAEGDGAASDGGSEGAGADSTPADEGPDAPF